MLKVATAEVHESEEYRDVWVRFSTERGSSPVMLVANGVLMDAEQIGQAVLQQFSYLIRSEVFNAAT